MPDKYPATAPAIRFAALPTAVARGFQAADAAPPQRDANGQAPERQLSDGAGVPCRHCLTELPAGTPYLLLAHRPFPAPQPYAEIGPIFLCAAPCRRWSGDGVPEMLRRWPSLLMRGYGADDRIVGGSGRHVAGAMLAETASALFASTPEIAYLHLRSSTNNCYQARIDRV